MDMKMAYPWHAVLALHLLPISIQQMDLTSYGFSSQSSTLFHFGRMFNSTLAVDDNNSSRIDSLSCAITDRYQQFAWWMLSFPSTNVYVTSVSIIYRSDTLQRFANYSVHISNSTVQTGRRPDGLCYQHNLSTPNPLEEIDCYALGENVIIYNNYQDPTAFMELCDVKVFGCYKGQTGPGCTKSCPVNCLGTHCYPENATCVWGCSSENCLNDTCDKYNGVCEKGCKPGFRGKMCNEPCSPGYFGKNCSEKCHCFHMSCNRTTGVCLLGGCDRGFFGNNCATECTIGYYGFNCNETCSGCPTNSCDRFDGVCINTTHCEPGWLGEKCDQPCTSGTFGRKCTDKCHCATQPCNHISGACPSGGCDLGYYGSSCATACPPGLFGKNCSEICHCLVVNQSCHQVTGVCPPGGCVHGYYGDNCASVLELQQDNHECNCTVIIVGLCSAEMFIALIVAVAFYIRRKSRLHHKKTKEQIDIQCDTARYDGFELSAGHEQNPYDALGSEVGVTSRTKNRCSSDQTYADVEY